MCINYMCPWRGDINKNTQSWADKSIQTVEGLLQNKLSEYSQSEGLLTIKNNLNELSNGLEGVLFLPNSSNKTVNLIYLTRFNDGKESPFTEMQKRIFQMSQRTDAAATRCLDVGCCLVFTCGTAGVATIGPGCVNPSWLIPSLAAVGTTVSSIWSYFSTGIFPNHASDKANDKQNTFHQVKELYCELGCHLVELNEEDPDLAREIADNLNIKKIQEAMRSILSTVESEILVKPLLNAQKYVLDGTLPSSPPELRSRVEIVHLKKEVDYLRMLNSTLNGKSIAKDD